MSPRRLLREYVPASDRSFVAFAERVLDVLASIEGAPWPEPEEELSQLARFERRLRRRFPYASVELVERPSGRGRAAVSAGPGLGSRPPAPSGALGRFPAATPTVARVVRVFRDGGRSQTLW